MQGESEMDNKLIQKADAELIYFGVYNTRAELADAGDVLCSVRQKFFESGKRQKNRSTFNITGEIIRASYTMESGRPVKWKKLIGSRLAERVTIKDKCYCIESLDAERRCFKRAYFDLNHNWIYTDYFLTEGSGSPDCTFAPYTDGGRPAIILKTGTDKFETLYPFEYSLDRELTEKLNAAAGEPRVLCKTSSGTFYFCTKIEAQDRERALDRLLTEKDEDDALNDDELIEPGFEIAAAALEYNNEEIPADCADFSENNSTLDSQEYTSSTTDSTRQDTETETSEAIPENEDITDNELKEAAAVKEDTTEEQVQPIITETDGKAESKYDVHDESDNIGIQDFEFTEDRLFEESTTSQEAAVSTKQGELCAFSGQCPFENADKLIIESGGRQYFYFGGTNGDKRHGSGRTIMFDGKTAYEGSYKDDKRDGFGTYYFKSGKLCYAGSWSDNKREGLGAAFSSNDGSIFVGKWHENEPASVGASFDREGRLIYVGKTNEGRRSGTGITYSEESDTFFVGKYADGEFLGCGTQFDSSGNMLYSGGFNDGMRNGQGVCYNNDGSVKYKGLWKNNLYHGEGVLYLSDGCILKGTFRKGKADGNCTLYDPSGHIIYTGCYSDDLYNGAGRLYSDDGSYAEGRFADGEPTGVFNEYSQQGQLLYCGEWTDMQRNGKGVEYRNGEKVYEGNFSGGNKNGKGKLYENGELVYIGEFINGRVSGFGTELEGDDTVYCGMWDNGSYNGCGILYENGQPLFVGSFRNGIKDGRINQISGEHIIRKCIYENDKLTYMCEYGEDGSLRYYGNVSDGKRSGMGCSFNSACEKEFEGIFRNGKPEKAMSVLYKELEELPECEQLKGTDYEKYSDAPEYAVELSFGGGIYTGQVRGGIPEGRGTVMYFDHRFTGMFINGEPCGNGVIYMRDGSEIMGDFSPAPTPSCETLVFTNYTYYRKN